MSNSLTQNTFCSLESTNTTVLSITNVQKFMENREYSYPKPSPLSLRTNFLHALNISWIAERKKMWHFLFFQKLCCICQNEFQNFLPIFKRWRYNFLTRSVARAGGFLGIHVLKPVVLGKEKKSDTLIDTDYSLHYGFSRKAVVKYLIFWCQK